MDLSGMRGSTVTDRYTIAYLIDSLKLYERVELYDVRLKRSIIGNVCFIFRSNIERDHEDVKKYFQGIELTKWYASICKPGRRDWIVIRKDDGNYFTFPRTVAFSRYLLTLKVTELNIIETKNLRMKWEREDFTRGQEGKIDTDSGLGSSN